MNKYILQYHFDGNGTVVIEAESDLEAEKMFYAGEFQDEDEYSERYTVERINIIK